MGLISNLKYELVPYTRGKGLDLSAGTTKKMFRHWISKAETPAIDFVGLDAFANKSLDFIFSAGYLEGMAPRERGIALGEWYDKIRNGGHICLSWDKADLSPEAMIGQMSKLQGGWELVHASEHPLDDETTGCLQVYKKAKHGRHVFSHNRTLPEKTVVVIRYGAIGDCIVASSVVRKLKRDGWHVIFNTQGTGYEILKGNPHIDEFLLQDKDQLQNEDLSEYWAFLQQKYGRIVNLSETMEGAICSFRGRSDFTWPIAVRRRFRGHNYYDFAHAVAEVDGDPEPGFYPTKAERDWAKEQRAGIGKDRFIIMWVLSGSAKHKQLFQMDDVLGTNHNGILDTFPNAHVIMVGDDWCRFLESGWENHPQVTRTSGEWSVRQTLSMLNEVDLVVGPETGIINAAGAFGVPTVVCISHTSENTLCKYWKDYTAVKPVDCECSPCYRIQHSDESCNIVDVGYGAQAAKCVANISVEQMFTAIADRIKG